MEKERGCFLKMSRTPEIKDAGGVMGHVASSPEPPTRVNFSYDGKRLLDS